MSSAADKPLSRSSGSSWRQIRQGVQRHVMSRTGRRRRVQGWCKLSLRSCGTVLAAWGLYEIAHAWQTDRAAVTDAIPSDPVRDLSVVTDRGGVLTKAWVRDVLDLPPNASLMTLDLAALRGRLLAFPQVRGAELTRQFPDVLGVSLQERTPVVRVQAVDAQGFPQQLLVAKDGVVYAGLNYDPQKIAGLPYLDGARLVRDGRGFRPIEGMDAVSDLLSTAQLQAPHLYSGWRVVSLARLAGQDEIVVRSQEIPEVVFSRAEAFFPQLARLDYVTDAMNRLPNPAIKTVNLALGSHVPITPERPPEELLKTPPPPTHSRKASRDL